MMLLGFCMFYEWSCGFCLSGLWPWLFLTFCCVLVGLRARGIWWLIVGWFGVVLGYMIWGLLPRLDMYVS